MYEYPGHARPGEPSQPPAGDWRYGPPQRRPSGLFPSGPVRPSFREQHPIHGAAVATGLSGAAAWLLVFGLLGRDLAGYAWSTVVAAVLAWLTALLLARYGDRGVAAGISITTALALSIVTTAVAVRWIVSDDWPLW